MIQLYEETSAIKFALYNIGGHSFLKHQNPIFTPRRFLGKTEKSRIWISNIFPGNLLS